MKRTEVGQRIVLAIVICIAVVGCMKVEAQEGENAVVEQNREALKEFLDCNDREADSLLKQMELAGVSDITDIKAEETKYDTILECHTKDTQTYYAFVDKRLFLSSIRTGAKDGEEIYSAIE